MRLSNILEASADKDMEFRIRAREAFLDLVDYLRDVKRLDHDYNNRNGRYGWTKNGDFIIMDKNLPGDLKGMLFKFTSKGNSSFGDADGRPAIVLNILHGQLPWETKDFDLASKLRNYGSKSFVHEFIHYLDQTRSKHKNIVTLQKKLGYTGYYNHPLESNAYYQEAMDALDGIFAKKQPDMVYDIAFGKGVQGFVEWVKRAGLDKKFLANLYPETKRKLDKRLAQAYLKYKKEVIDKGWYKG